MNQISLGGKGTIFFHKEELITIRTYSHDTPRATLTIQEGHQGAYGIRAYGAGI